MRTDPASTHLVATQPAVVAAFACSDGHTAPTTAAARRVRTRRIATWKGLH